MLVNRNFFNRMSFNLDARPIEDDTHPKLKFFQYIDLIWIINVVKPQSDDTDLTFYKKAIKKVLNSSNKALMKRFKTDNPVACFYEVISGNSAVDYLSHMAPKDSKLDRVTPRNIYLAFKFLTPKNYSFDGDFLDDHMIDTPSKIIRNCPENLKGKRNMLLNLTKDSIIPGIDHELARGAFSFDILEVLAFVHAFKEL